MAEIRDRCTKEILGKLARCPVRALIGGKESVVQANNWESVSDAGKSCEGYLVAEAIRTDVIDMQADGTPLADSGTQGMLSSEVTWGNWNDACEAG